MQPYDSAFCYWSRLLKKNDEETIFSDEKKLTRLTDKLLKDAQGYIDDMKARRERILEPLGLADLKYAEITDIEAMYQKIADDKSEESTLKQTTVSLYLTFRNCRAFYSAFGVQVAGGNGETAGERHKRLYTQYSEDRAPIGYILNILEQRVPETYTAVWNQIAEYMDTATAPEVKHEVAITKERYRKELRFHDKDNCILFDPAKNRGAYTNIDPYNGPVKYGVKERRDNRGHITRTLELTYGVMERDKLVENGETTELFFEACGLNQFDRAVCTAISTIYDQRSKLSELEYTVIPMNEIAVLIFPKEPVTKERLADVKESCEKMRRTFVKITFGAKSKQMGTSYLDGYLLPYYGSDVYVKEYGARIDAIALSSPPIMLKLGQRCNLISRPKLPAGKSAEKIENGLPNYNKSFIALREYIRQKIELIDRMAQAEWKKRVKANKALGVQAPSINDAYSEDQRLLKTADIYKAMGAETTRNQRTVRTNTETVLQEMIERKLIESYKIIRAGKTIKGYEIICISKK